MHTPRSSPRSRSPRLTFTPTKVFISWSGARSGAVALALKNCLSTVLPNVVVWTSKSDIAPGVRWSNEISHQLSETNFGILCLDAEAAKSPWVLFEAGALAKAIDEARVVPYLLGLTDRELSAPLNHFQARSANRKGTLDLVMEINKSRDFDGGALTETSLKTNFQRTWPRFNLQLRAALAGAKSAHPRKSVDEMLLTVLTEVRDIGARLPMNKRRENRASRFRWIKQAVATHPSMVERSIFKAGSFSASTWSTTYIILEPMTASGPLRASIDVDDWARLDTDEAQELVIEPLVRGLAEQFDARSKRPQ